MILGREIRRIDTVERTVYPAETVGARIVALDDLDESRVGGQGGGVDDWELLRRQIARSPSVKCYEPPL